MTEPAVPPRTLTWVASEGGPLLLLPERLLPAWEGADPPSGGRVVEAEFRWAPGGPATDYDRACDVADYVGVIAVGTGYGLVLGDEPLPTSWLPSPGGGVLARWRYAPDDAGAERALAAMPTRLPWQHALDFEFDVAPLVLFDAAWPRGEQFGGALRIPLSAGAYAVDSVEYAPDAETAFLLHRLRRYGAV